MTRPVWRTAVIVVVAALVCAAPQTLVRGESIESFAARKSKWPMFVGLRFTLDGRYSSVSYSPALKRSVLKFQKCGMTFWSLAGRPFPRFARKSKTIEVKGRIEKQNGKLVFVVTEVREIPGDLEIYNTKRPVSPNDAQGWYALAKWATARGAFYDDDELKAKAAEANHNGVKAERSRLDDALPSDLLGLAAKAKILKLPDAVQHEYVHEAYIIRWQAAKKERGADLPTLAKELAAALPGCGIPLPQPEPDLRKEYLSNALATYRIADTAARRKLNRILYGEIQLRGILQTSAPDGSNGSKVAAELDRILPEQRALAESYRDKQLAYGMAHVEKATKAEALSLAQQFEQRKQPGKGREALDKWLKARTKLLAQDGAAGLIQAAHDHLDVRDDRESAVALLLQAYDLSPESKTVAEELKLLGYVFKDGKWLEEGVAAALPPDPTRQGRIATGMTRDQIRDALGAPRSVVRVATSGAINEIWSYGKRGTSGLAIHFLHRTHRRDEPATVVNISKIEPR